MTLPWRPTILAVGLSVGVFGCGSSTDTHVVALSDSEKNLSNIVLACLDAHESLRHYPKNAEELKPFLKRFGDPEAMLKSPVDGEPYVIVWGTDLSRGGPTPYQQMFPIFGYEKKGAGGKRAIVDVRGRPLTVPSDDFSKLTFVAGHKPDAN
jgi:hypothetical protein